MASPKKMFRLSTSDTSSSVKASSARVLSSSNGDAAALISTSGVITTQKNRVSPLFFLLPLIVIAAGVVVVVAEMRMGAISGPRDSVLLRRSLGGNSTTYARSRQRRQKEKQAVPFTPPPVLATHGNDYENRAKPPAFGSPPRPAGGGAGESDYWYRTVEPGSSKPRILVTHAEKYGTIVNTLRVAASPLNMEMGRKGERFDIIYATRGGCTKGPYKPPYGSINPDVMVGCFSGLASIGAKTNLPRTLKRMYGEKDIADVLPKTFALPEENDAFFKYAKAHPDQTWILKTNKHRGEGILLASGDDIATRSVAIERYGLAQIYLSNPLLFDGYKFGIRLWAVVRSVNPLRVYLYSDGLALFTTEKYSNEGSALKDKTSQLTNNAVNRGKGAQQVWNMETLADEMDSAGLNYSMFWEFVEDSMAKTFISAEPSLKQFQTEILGGAGPAYYDDNFFEVFGFDFIIDSKGHPWLLEINFTPALTISNPVQKASKVAMLRDTLSLVWKGRGRKTYHHKKKAVEGEWKDRSRPFVVGKGGETHRLFHEELHPLLESEHFCKDIAPKQVKEFRGVDVERCVPCLSLEDIENIDRALGDEKQL
uniref:Tubulin--tyrosine ligase-like protein 5 n=1 Tax=Palpitomonas bilix TaxID=652834 RepID=A0A7S3DF18_9EUKA|mmetsp:Transcript_34626/g.89800  ORF Transcript_34626/g.89800 Transcript_34626/m.89800 type:complete len:595 (+) Transcript_34626:271-2055(+)